MRRTLLFVAALGPLVVACASEAPDREQMLHFEGRVLLEGLPPDPLFSVNVYSFADSFPPASRSSVTVPLDSSGHYEGQLGPFVNGHVDSLVLPLYQPLCGSGPTTTVRLVDVNVEAGTAVFPPLDLHYPAALGRLGVGQVVCGATNQDTFLGEKLGLRLIFDSLTDSVYGRWDISHTASVGDAFGRFVGSADSGRLLLPLTPYLGVGCAGIVLTTPIQADSTLAITTMTGQPDPGCYVPAGRLRLFRADDGWPPGLPL